MPLTKPQAAIFGDTISTGIPGTSFNPGATIYEQTSTLVTNYCITTNTNAFTFGPVTVADNVIITVPDGSAWTVL
jgi:hypothetical protein